MAKLTQIAYDFPREGALVLWGLSQRTVHHDLTVTRPWRYYLHPYVATFGLVLAIVTLKSADHFISRIVLNHIMIISAEYGRILSVSRMCEIDIQSF